jgi:hypothetical protein
VSVTGAEIMDRIFSSAPAAPLMPGRHQISPARA